MSKPVSEIQAEILKKALENLQHLADEAEMDRRFREAEKKRLANYSPLEWELKARFEKVEARRIELANNHHKRQKVSVN